MVTTVGGGGGGGLTAIKGSLINFHLQSFFYSFLWQLWLITSFTPVIISEMQAYIA